MTLARLIHFGSLGILALAALIILSGKTNLLGGYHAFGVLTGSMEPMIPVDSLLLVRHKPADTLQTGDVITFEQPAGSDQLVTHRIVANENGSFRTQGDANPEPDPWLVTDEQIHGKVVWGISQLGAVLRLLNSPSGLILLILLPVAFLAFKDLYAIHTALYEMSLERKQARGAA